MRTAITTFCTAGCKRFGMPNVSRTPQSKQPNRPHFIPQWAKRRGLTQADLARELEADKSLVSRWFNGASPALAWQTRLAKFFEIERDGLFRDPDDDWLYSMFRGRSDAEKARIRATIEAAFPRRDGSNG